ncbi:hypothetical protein Taro_014970 [Colocasia esculenta]|uniref:Pentatricopeptide repeat-containing protein n=1 Tax=Colocasia esculenta TaxID=4460 RepID=A0A843URT5_COLES|nr:hypothetical protein [Colocasia esculenta]
MVAAPCLACAPDPCPLQNPSSSSVSPPPTLPSPAPTARLISSPREALRFLKARCRTPCHLKQAHAYLIRCGLGRHPDLLTALLRRYASHGGAHIRAAAAAFSELPQPPPAFAWNVMMRALTLAGRPYDALFLYYNRMAVAGVPPDKFTFPSAVKACAACSDLRKGMEVHARAIKIGLCVDIFLQNILMHLYLKCEEGDALYGHLMFARMRVRNMVSWTTLVSGFAARGDLESARGVFEEMPLKRNVVTWTAMVDAYARNGQPEEAFEMFRKMQVENVQPNEFTLVALLIACTELGSKKLGRWVHDYARKNGSLDDNVYVGTALIDMYSKFGSLEEARRVFDGMPQKSIATWNSMITGLGVHGHGREAIDLFREMEKVGLRPDEITFKGVLCACVRAGLTLEAFELFRDMMELYGITPTSEHYHSVVELLERAGVREETQQLVEKLRTEQEDVEILQTLLIAREAYHANQGEELLRQHVHAGLEQSSDAGSDVSLQDHEQLGWEVG